VDLGVGGGADGNGCGCSFLWQFRGVEVELLSPPEHPEVAGVVVRIERHVLGMPLLRGLHCENEVHDGPRTQNPLFRQRRRGCCPIVVDVFIPVTLIAALIGMRLGHDSGAVPKGVLDGREAVENEAQLRWRGCHSVFYRYRRRSIGLCWPDERRDRSFPSQPVE